MRMFIFNKLGCFKIVKDFWIFLLKLQRFKILTKFDEIFEIGFKIFIAQLTIFFNFASNNSCENIILFAAVQLDEFYVEQFDFDLPGKFSLINQNFVHNTSRCKLRVCIKVRVLKQRRQSGG